MTRKILPDSFFNRPTLFVARDLIGKFLVRRIGRKEVALMIVETEAYHGWNDLASHARRGQTPRNTPMFAEAGTIYVYFTYGMHWMLNLVCGKKEFPAAVLVRGVCRTTSLQTGVCKDVVLNGPGKLTKAMGIDKRLTGRKLRKKSGLWVEDRGVKINPRHIRRTGRIGVEHSGEWAKKPWRFVYVVQNKK